MTRQTLSVRPDHDAFELIERWARAFAAADVDALLGLFDRDAIFLGTGSTTIVKQHDGIREYFEEVLLGSKRFSASILDHSLVALNDNTAIVTLLDNLEATVDGKTPTKQAYLGRATFVLSKRESGWKIVHFHRSKMPD